MARDSASESFGKVALGGAVGFALYFLITKLGLGGRGESEGRGEGPGEAAPSAPSPTPPAPPSPLPPVPPSRQPPPTPRPTRPRDKQAVSIVVQPSPTDPQRAVIVMEGRNVSIGELIARIDKGGRNDVSVTVTGDTMQGAWDEIHDALQFAGIRIFKLQKPRSQISGNTRGQYG